MTRSKRASIVFRILPGLLLAACCATAHAADPSREGEGPERPTSETASAGVGVSGMRVVIDPKTGEIRSIPVHGSRALSESLAHALNQSTEGLVVFDIPAGGKGVHLDGRFQHVVTVKVQSDGSFELGCVDSALNAKDVLHGKAAGSDDASRDR